MNINDIVIRESFANTTPRTEKMKVCRDYWKEHHKQDRYIVVDRNNVLIDGYIQYLVLKENNIDDVEIRIGKIKKKRWKRKSMKDNWDTPKYREELTTYIIGTHNNGNSNKGYMWRVPNNWTWISDNLQVGDTVFCRTRKSNAAPITITKIMKLDRCPVDYPVSKMCYKTIIRDGIRVE